MERMDGIIEENIKSFSKGFVDIQSRIAELEEENKKLKLENADLMGERDGLKMVIDKLKEENQTLELWLDNKEKLNEEYRKKIDELKSDLAYERTMLDNVKAEYKSLQNVNKKLKERIEALELCIDID